MDNSLNRFPEASPEDAVSIGDEDESAYFEDDEDGLGLATRPIVVGYAFGPKKMSTMGVVMAEASKTKISRSILPIRTKKASPRTNLVAGNLNRGSVSGDTFRLSSEEEKVPVVDHEQRLADQTAMPSPTNAKLLSKAVFSNDKNSHVSEMATVSISPIMSSRNDGHDNNPEQDRGSSHDTVSPQSVRKPVAPTEAFPSQTQEQQQQRETIVFTIDNGLVARAGMSTGEAGLRNIVRYFRSSCSSVADSASTGTCTASSTTGSQRTAASATTRPTLSSSGSSSRRIHKTRPQYPVHVSFVPLDMEIPLEDQHGGQMDVILHKLTEDILCLSQLSLEHPQLKKLPDSQSSTDDEEMLQTYALGSSDLAAVRRVHRLALFQRNHPECYLVDDPSCVQTVMSRSDIAVRLQSCLKGVSSESGIPVGSPPFVVLHPQGHDSGGPLLLQQVQEAGLQFPVIIKPLIAAGTKASHAMAVVLEGRALDRREMNTPCLCQEYTNHDSLLYKVYVLGDHVSVHKRRSLPNLPSGRKFSKGYLEFDSQRPYPRLSDFGIVPDEAVTGNGGTLKNNNDPAGLPVTKRPKHELPTLNVTASEVRPIVYALKQAFGLELFGFDVIIRSRRSSCSTFVSANESSVSPQMLVVDVNYFPSYKEVKNFPNLLAQYLIDRAIECRRSANASL